MATFFESLNPKQIAFIDEQQLFFTASAYATGRVNLSPKGMDCFRVLDNNTVAYLDMYGSGNETAAHLQNDGRLTVMFCSFGKLPLIMRLYGRGEVVPMGSEEWQRLSPKFKLETGARQLIVLHVESVQESCGYGVPRYELIGERDTLRRYCEADGAEKIASKHAAQTTSIDGLPISTGG
jgi:Pyridoxamine 5'-phosphate oxidase